MPTRALGALLAAVAAALFVVSIVTAAWWSGHPRVDGHVFFAKDVHIGLLGGQGCNTGGAGACQSLELGPTFTIAGYAELALTALATMLALLVAGAAWRVSDGRKRLAKAALLVAAIAALGALALLVLGPQIKSSQKVEAPIGFGLLVFAGGVAASFVSSLVTMRVEREPLRLKTSAAGPAGFDVHDILREQHDGLRPSGPRLQVGPGATGNLPGPAGPLGVPQAPQLRPLYDVEGALPAPAAPHLPERPPTPIPRASAHAIAGLDYERPPTFESAETAQNARPLPPGFDPRGRPPTGAPPFGSQGAPPFGSAGAPSFGSQGASPFGSQGAPPFGSTNAPPFGSTNAPPFGSTNAPPFGSAGNAPFDGRAKPPTGAPPFGPPRGAPPLGTPGGASFDGRTSSPMAVPPTPPFDARGKSPTGAPPAPPFDARGKSPTGAPPFGSPGAPGFDGRAGSPPAPPFDARGKSPTGAPPFDARGKSPTGAPPFARPATQPPPFAQPAIVPPATYEPHARPGTAVRVKAASVPPPPSRSSAVHDAAADPLGKTMPAPGKTQPPPTRGARPSVPPPARSGVRPIVPLPARPIVPAAGGAVPAGPVTSGPTPTPSILTSAPPRDQIGRAGSPRPDIPAPRASQPTLSHTVPPMPQIDTPPPQLRAPTEADGRLEVAMRETDYITAVEIDAEAKAAAKASGTHAAVDADEATGIGEPPVHDGPVMARTTSEERDAIHDEGLEAHDHGDVAGDDSDAAETAARERMDLDALEEAAPRKAPVKPPLSTAPPSLPPPKTANIPATGPTPACPQCEAPMAWVEEHLRFYCKSCRMYF
jgi:hypothetical protein